MFKANLKLKVIAKVITSEDKDKFEAELQKFLDDGYELVSSNCGFINSEQYDFADYYQAILIKNESVMEHKPEGE